MSPSGPFSLFRPAGAFSSRGGRPCEAFPTFRPPFLRGPAGGGPRFRAMAEEEGAAPEAVPEEAAAAEPEAVVVTGKRPSRQQSAAGPWRGGGRLTPRA